jgi:hypothetical protein
VSFFPWVDAGHGCVGLPIHGKFADGRTIWIADVFAMLNAFPKEDRKARELTQIFTAQETKSGATGGRAKVASDPLQQDRETPACSQAGSQFG